MARGRITLSWNDAGRWSRLGEVLPMFMMWWLYDIASANRLKHHQWMLTRPSFQQVAQDVHQTLIEQGDAVIQSVALGDDYPTGAQRDAAFRLFRRLQRPDGEQIISFLFATACELIGATPYCKFTEPELASWVAAANAAKVPRYDNVRNLVDNVLVQEMLWTLGYLPYAELEQWIDGHIITLSLVPNRSIDQREKLFAHNMAVYRAMQRLSRHS